MFKRKVYDYCVGLLERKLEGHQRAMRELVESGANETKSTAGDKYETARAMLHIEQDNVRRQMAEVGAQRGVLGGLDPDIVREAVGLGSLVRTDGGYYYLTVGLGKVVVDDVTVIVLSPQSPLGGKLMGRVVGDRVEMNGKGILVEGVE